MFVSTASLPREDHDPAGWYDEPPEEQRRGVAQAAGFSLHAGIGIEADAR